MKATCAEAIEAGERRYFTGKPCPKGHIAARFIGNSGCVECAAERRLKNKERHAVYSRQHYQANKEEYIKRAKKWGLENPTERKKIRDEWVLKNPDWVKKHNGEWGRKNPDRARENAYKWRRANPDKFRAIGRRWQLANPERAKIRSVIKRSKPSPEGYLTVHDVKAIVSRQKGKCAVCAKKCKLEMDHIMPVALGGSSHRHNFQGLCRSCNSRKRAQHPVDFNRSRGLLL